MTHENNKSDRRTTKWRHWVCFVSFFLFNLSWMLGVFTELAIALDGTGITWFGFHANFWGAIPSALFFCVWLFARPKGSRWITLSSGLFALVVVLMFNHVASELMLLSWESACSEKRPDVCLVLADGLAKKEQKAESLVHYRKACKAGVYEACAGLRKHSESSEDSELVERVSRNKCASYRDCQRDKFSTDECREQLKSVDDLERFCRSRNER